MIWWINAEFWLVTLYNTLLFVLLNEFVWILSQCSKSHQQQGHIETSALQSHAKTITLSSESTLHYSSIMSNYCSTITAVALYGWPDFLFSSGTCEHYGMSQYCVFYHESSHQHLLWSQQTSNMQSIHYIFTKVLQ